MQRLFKVLGVSIFCFWMISPGVPACGQSAQPDKDAVRMDEVVVMATRDRQEVRKVAANVTVITSEDILKSGANSIPEVLTGLEGLYVRGTTGNASQASVDMRGFGENGYGRTVVTLDGVRINRPDMASVNWLEIPLSEIERIEVSRGANSVLYGDAAIAGTINIVTKKGDGKPKGEVAFIGGSYNTLDGRAGVRGTADKLSYAFSAEGLHTDGYRDRSKYGATSGGGNIGYTASEYLDVSLGATYNKSDFQFPGYLTRDQVDRNPQQAQPGHNDDDGTNKFFGSNLFIKSVLGNYGRLDANLIYGNRETTTNFPTFSSFYVADIDTLGATPRYILDRKIFSRGNKLIVGFDYYHETLNADRYSDRNQTVQTTAAEITRESTGVYIRDEFNILSDLILSLGGRAERVTVDGQITSVPDSEKIHHGEAFEAALTYLLGEKSKVFAKYAKVYRIPFLDEQATYLGFGADSFNTDLEKETGNSYEAGVVFYPTNDLKIGITAYRIDMDDEIKYVFDPATFIGQNVNLDKTRHQGVEVSLVYDLKKMARLAVNYTYQDVYFRDGVNQSKDVPLVPKSMANASLEIFLPYSLSIKPEVRYVGKQYFGQDESNSYEQLDDYTLYNLFLFYRPAFGNYRLTAFVGVENLTDEAYSTYGFASPVIPGNLTFYPSPGITAKGGLTLNF